MSKIIRMSASQLRKHRNSLLKKVRKEERRRETLTRLESEVQDLSRKLMDMRSDTTFFGNIEVKEPERDTSYGAIGPSRY